MLNVLDLFAGIGGFSLGLERTGGFHTVGFCEQDKVCQRVLAKHWPDVPIFDDVRTLTKDSINERIDVITGGFPCQDISLAGKGAGLAGERSGLWFEFRRLIAEIRPQWAIIENVSALRSRGLDVVLRSLAEIGYDAEWHCIPAAAVGAPHRRDRIWIIAYMADAGRGRRSGSGEGQMELSRGAEALGAGEALADAATVGRGEERPLAGGGSEGDRTEGYQRGGPLLGRPELAHTDLPRLEGWLKAVLSERPGELPARTSSPRWIGETWFAEPDVGRVAHGVPGRVDRLKQLGNAVVPQIPELIGRALLSSTRATISS